VVLLSVVPTHRFNGFMGLKVSWVYEFILGLKVLYIRSIRSSIYNASSTRKNMY
jgi:hypothetical protein